VAREVSIVSSLVQSNLCLW